jgi:hypothetical protein
MPVWRLEALRMKRKLRVIDGSADLLDHPAGEGRRRPSAVEAAYQHFRLDRQGSLVARSTLDHYDWTMLPFLEWLAVSHPAVRAFEDLDVQVVREWRVVCSERLTRHGKPYEAASLHDFHRSLKTFLTWAEAEGYAVDPRTLRLKGIRVPLKEPTVFHVNQLRKILAACQHPREDIAVRILAGSGVRCTELTGLALVGPDGLPDLMLDSMDRGRVELRVRWDGGAKGRKVEAGAHLAASRGGHEAVRGKASRAVAVRRLPGQRAWPTLHPLGHPAGHGADQQPGWLPRPRPRLPAHLRHRGDPAGLELRAPPSGDGPRRLPGPPALRPPGHRARPRAGARLGGVHPHALGDGDRRRPAPLNGASERGSGNPR